MFQSAIKKRVYAAILIQRSHYSTYYMIYAKHLLWVTNINSFMNEL